MSSKLSQLDMSSRIQTLLLDAQVVLSTNLTKLYESWKRVGHPEDVLKHRETQVFDTIQKTIEAIVEDEGIYEQKKLKAVERLGAEYHALMKELGVHVQLSPQDDGLFQLELELRRVVLSLREAKETRMSELRSLCEKDSWLCKRLAVNTFSIDKTKLPSQPDIDALKQHIQEARVELEKREAKFVKLRERVIQLLTDLEAKPDTTLEVSTVCDDVDTFTLSEGNLAAVKNYCKTLEERLEKQKQRKERLVHDVNLLWNRLDVPVSDQQDFTRKYNGLRASDMKAWEKELERCKELKRQNLQVFIERLREELSDYWERCMVGPITREGFVQMTSQDWSEELLELHELEVTKYQSLYTAHKQIFLKIKRREDLFERMLDLEKRAKYPDRLFGNRGCSLLQEEKERKRIVKDLPKVEEELEMLLRSYEQNCGRILTVKDNNYIDYMKDQWQKYEADKENERQQKAKARARQLEDEAKGGTKPTTPVKRRLGNTQTTHTASPKMRRLDGPVMGTSKQVLPKQTPAREGTNLRHAVRRVLQERAASGNAREETPLADITAASTATTYSDFTHGLEEKARKDHCRSSILMKNVNSTMTHSRFDGPSTVPRRRSPRLALLRTPGTPRSNMRSPRTPICKSPSAARRNLAIARTPSGLPFLI